MHNGWTKFINSCKYFCCSYARVAKMEVGIFAGVWKSFFNLSSLTFFQTCRLADWACEIRPPWSHKDPEREKLYRSKLKSSRQEFLEFITRESVLSFRVSPFPTASWIPVPRMNQWKKSIQFDHCYIRVWRKEGEKNDTRDATRVSAGTTNFYSTLHPSTCIIYIFPAGNQRNKKCNLQHKRNWAFHSILLSENPM